MKRKFNRASGGGPSKRKKVTIASVNAKVNKMIRSSEKKWYDVGQTLQIPAAGQVYSLSWVPVGDSPEQREGRKIGLTSLQIRVFIPALSTASVGKYRLMVVLDRQSDGGTAPAVLDILEEATAFSQLNAWNSERFRVLFDDTNGIGANQYTTGLVGGAASRTQVTTINKYLKLDMETTFTAGNGPSANHLYLLVIGDDGAAVPSAYSNDGVLRCRMRFTDN